MINENKYSIIIFDKQNEFTEQLAEAVRQSMELELSAVIHCIEELQLHLEKDTPSYVVLNFELFYSQCKTPQQLSLINNNKMQTYVLALIEDWEYRDRSITATVGIDFTFSRRSADFSVKKILDFLKLPIIDNMDQ